MKHKIFALGVTLICILGLTACGETIQKNTVAGSRYDAETFTMDTLSSIADTIEDGWFEAWYLDGVTPDNFEDRMFDDITSMFDEETYDIIKAGYRNWFDAVDELGYHDMGSLADDISVKSTEFYVNKDGQLFVDSIIEGSGPNAHTAILEYSLDRNLNPTLISVNVNHTLGEKLKSAGLNTLLGMGMAFTVLIIIALVISLFPLIGKVGEKKPETDKEITQKSMENVTAQIADKEEELSDDSELVAVIAAAIAAYEGSGSADGYVVRSIRKRPTGNWKKA